MPQRFISLILAAWWGTICFAADFVETPLYDFAIPDSSEPVASESVTFNADLSRVAFQSLEQWARGFERILLLSEPAGRKKPPSGDFSSQWWINGERQKALENTVLGNCRWAGAETLACQTVVVSPAGLVGKMICLDAGAPIVVTPASKRKFAQWVGLAGCHFVGWESDTERGPVDIYRDSKLIASRVEKFGTTFEGQTATAFAYRGGGRAFIVDKNTVRPVGAGYTEMSEPRFLRNGASLFFAARHSAQCGLDAFPIAVLDGREIYAGPKCADVNYFTLVSAPQGDAVAFVVRLHEEKEPSGYREHVWFHGHLGPALDLVSGLRLSANGKWVVYYANEKDPKAGWQNRIYIQGETGAIQSPKAVRSVLLPTVDDDGRLTSYVESQAKGKRNDYVIWERGTTTSPGHYVAGVISSSDGKQLAFVLRDTALKRSAVWFQGKLSKWYRALFNPSFSDDGKMLRFGAVDGKKLLRVTLAH